MSTAITETTTTSTTEVLEQKEFKDHQDEHHIRRHHSIEYSLVARIIQKQGFERQVKAIEALQQKYVGTPTGRILAGISLLGSGKVVLVVLTVFFWLLRPNSWAPTRAASLALSLVGIVKALFKGPRPYWLSKKLLTLDPTLEVSFGFPSGHTAAVAATYGLLAYREGHQELAIWALLLVAVAISRVFTAAHFIHDVAGGAILGLSVLTFLVSLDNFELSHLQLGLFSISASAVTLTTVISQYGFHAVPFHLVQEGLSGSGFLLGLSLCHFAESFVRASLDSSRGALPFVACVGGIVGIVFINKVLKSLLAQNDNLTFAEILVCLLLYASVNLWALWLVPLLVDDFLLLKP
jgi:membrane-associated phospholipid phosphatase